MALIKCPECGKEVSDAAAACPQCGFPISSLRTDGTVMIKIFGGLGGTVTILDYSTEKPIWRGCAGDTAVFNIPKPTRVYLNWGLGNFKNKDYNITVEAGGKYELAEVPGFWAPKLILRRVDIIDSGI